VLAIANDLEKTAHLRNFYFVNEVLTTKGKDRGNVVREIISAYRAPPAPRPFGLAAAMARVRSGNGEQAWL
jgi:hypothetical protein